MLYTDSSSWLTIKDLIVLDPSISGSDPNDVATVENVPTTGTATFIQSAIEEAAATLQGFFQNFGYNFFSLNTPAYQQNVLYGIYDSTPPPRVTMGQIVVDSATTLYPSPLKRWVAHLALRNFYQMVSNRIINDKYQAKTKEIQADINNKVWPAFKAIGLPVVFFPLQAPGAVYELNAGSWGNANLSETQFSININAPSVSYDIQVTYVNGDGTESGPSERATWDLSAAQQIIVDISTVIPPIGVTSWKIYGGLTGQTMFYQTTNPIGTTSYTFGSKPVTTGTPVGRGQSADTTLTFINAFFKG